MEPVLINIEEPCAPQILVKTDNFLLVYKPPKMHSAPGKGASLSEWCVDQFPEIRDLQRPGASPSESKWEGGLLHRLDYETHGLVLFARNQESFQQLLFQQNQGMIIKEYGALISTAEKKLPGFPPFNGTLFSSNLKLSENSDDNCIKHSITSYFRPYGPGRKEVRPVESNEDQGKPYCTEIIEEQFLKNGGFRYIRLRILRGFRHQIRCHLAWTGFSVLNDPLYGGRQIGKGILALQAQGIKFFDPDSGEELHYDLPALRLLDLF